MSMRRRGFLGAVMAAGWGGNPAIRPDQANQLPRSRAGSGPAPQSLFVVAQRVIVFGPNGGIFIYTPAPGAGNLIYSDTAIGGTDPYGNVFLQGPTAYTAGLSPIAINMSGGQLSFQTAATQAGPYTTQAAQQLAAGNDFQILGGGATLATVLDFVGSGGQLSLSGADFDIATAGRGLRVKEGANARLGTATLSGGTITVANTTVTAATRVLYARSVAGGTLGFLSRTISVGVSFTINSSSNLDTSQIAWMLVEPG